MNSFKDKKNRQWIVRVDVAAIRRVRSTCNIDLANLIAIKPNGEADTNVLNTLANDPILLVEVVNAIILPQLAAQNITSEEWADSLDGETIQAATYALLEGAAEFFPPQKKTLTMRLLQMTKRKMDEASEQLSKALDILDSDAPQSTAQSAAAPESSASTPPQ